MKEDDILKPSIFKDLSSLDQQSLDKIHKDEITSVHLMYEEDYRVQKIVTTSMDGFIKMIDTRDRQVKKAFFVC